MARRQPKDQLSIYDLMATQWARKAERRAKFNKKKQHAHA